MIYIGFIDFNDDPYKVQALRSALESYTKTPSMVIKKRSLYLVYSKFSSHQDNDDIWENENSILIGRIFDKTKKSLFEKEDFNNLASLSKEELLEKIWGKYVYIQVNKRGSQFNVIVDPTGQLPFFYYHFSNGNVLFASSIEIIFKVLGENPEYNWTYLCSYLMYGNSSAIQTPFKNVYELPPTCHLKISKNERETKPFWNPLTYYTKAASSPQKDVVETLQATLQPLIEPYKNICVSLSGGLDSSSLVYCLKDIVKKDQTLKALNYFHSSIKSSNEVVHARKVCEETGIKLIEIEYSRCLPFDLPLRKSLFNPNKPSPVLIGLRELEYISEYLSSDGSCIFLNGNGSDHIFMCPPTKRSLCDYILEQGFIGSKKQLKNIAHFYRDSFAPIIKENAMVLSSYLLSRRLDKRHPKNIEDKTPDWMKQELRHQASSDFKHPIYTHLPSQILPGKYDQIDALYDALASIHIEMDQVNPTYFPYLCQPVIELALAFPTYKLFDNGYDRYPLRKAVSNHFNTETVWRRDKGRATGTFQLGVKKNLEYIFDLCLEGHLIKQGLVDKEKLRQTILLISNGNINHLWPFIHLASCEIFLKYWEEKVL